jgi:hypothetical protein
MPQFLDSITVDYNTSGVVLPTKQAGGDRTFRYVNFARYLAELPDADILDPTPANYTVTGLNSSQAGTFVPVSVLDQNYRKSGDTGFAGGSILVLGAYGGGNSSLQTVKEDRYSITCPTANGQVLELVLDNSVVQALKTNPFYNDIVSRAAYRAANVGNWRQLGTMTDDYFRESDILYNDEDGNYYVFNTEWWGNPPASVGYTDSTAANPTTVTLAAARKLWPGQPLALASHTGTGVLGGVKVNFGGSGYVTAPTVGFTGGGGSGATATANLTGTVVTSITINNPGSGYTSQPSVTFTPTSGGVGANATAFVSGVYPAGTFTVATVIDSTHFTVQLPPGATGGGTATTGTFTFSTLGRIGMRRASTLEGLATASGTNYNPAVCRGLWYPTVRKVGTGATAQWHIWGLASTGSFRHAVCTGTVPNWTGDDVVHSVNVSNGGSGYTGAPLVRIIGVGTGATAIANVSGGVVTSVTVTNGGSGYTTQPAVTFVATNGGAGAAGQADVGPGVPFITTGHGGGDHCVRQNPANGTWYMVMNESNTTTSMWTNTDITTETWTLLATEVFADAPKPTWGSTNVPDPNIAFVDGKMYLFYGANDNVNPTGIGMVQINPSTGKAIDSSLALIATTNWPSWAGATIPSDINFLRCPDGVDRIFGFCNNDPNDLTSDGPWGCLDLPAFSQLA